MKLRKCMQKKYFLSIYFSIVCISTNNVLKCLKCLKSCEVVGDINFEGTDI